MDDANDLAFLPNYEDSADLRYCDAHCHLDSILLNQKHGYMEWMVKKRICFNWVEGNCWYGSCCGFAHGWDDLIPRVPLQPADVEAFARRHISAKDATCSASLGGDEHTRLPPLAPSVWRRHPRLRAVITNCCDVESIPDTEMLVKEGNKLFGGTVFCTFGCHPAGYRDYDDAYEDRLLQALKACGTRAVAWGECGLDFAKHDASDSSQKARMMQVFSRQARLAVSLGLPLVVHSREADQETLEVFNESVPFSHPVHIHAFQGSPMFLTEVLRVRPNTIFGVSPHICLTWPGGAVEIARRCPLERLVLETDAPFLAGEPREVPKIAETLAKLKGVSVRQVLDVTSETCERFYRLHLAEPADTRGNAKTCSAQWRGSKRWHCVVDWEREARICALSREGRKIKTGN